jgi:hypothetical protein
LTGSRFFPLLLGGLLASCAPLANMRPAGMLVERGRSAEVGAAVVELGPRPYVTETWQNTGQVWATWAASRRIEVTGIGFFDDKAAAGGGALRWTPIRAKPFFGAAEIEAGYAWGAVALPLSVELHERIWIYTAPRLGNMGAYAAPGIPAGVSIEPIDRIQVRGEIQFSWRQFDPFQRRTHIGVGVGYAW